MESELNRGGFVFYKSYIDAARNLPPDAFKSFIVSICDYALYQIEPEPNSENDFIFALFTLAKPNIDGNLKQFLNGKKGGRPKAIKPNETQIEPNETQIKPNETQIEPNETLRIKNNNNNNMCINTHCRASPTSYEENPSPKSKKDIETEALITEVIQHLNEVAGTSYRATTPKTQSLVRARLKEGFVKADFFRVIDTMHKRWHGTEMARFVRPETLFGTKFESYLNENTVTDNIDHSLDWLYPN